MTREEKIKFLKEDLYSLDIEIDAYKRQEIIDVDLMHRIATWEEYKEIYQDLYEEEEWNAVDLNKPVYTVNAHVNSVGFYTFIGNDIDKILDTLINIIST